MLLDQNLVLDIIEKKWSEDLKNELQSFIMENVFLYDDKFLTNVDNVQLDEINQVELKSFDVEDEFFGEKTVLGLLQVDFSINGLAYWDREFHKVGHIDELLLAKFKFRMTREGYTGFQCKYI